MHFLLLNIFDTTLPVTDPILRYLIVIVIVLITPLLLNKIKIPHLIGLIIAGAIIGPNGIHLLDRDSSIVVSGTTGLLYIMFLAGLEIDLVEFKKNSTKSLVFGIYTFLTPMLLGILAGHWVLGYSWMTTVLLASLFASHTLLAYPIVSKLGVAKDRAVNIAVGGTMITDTLALLVLAVIVGMTQGEVNAAFWLRLTISILVFGLVVLLGFPVIARWFFKQVEDKIAQFIFVIVMLYLGAVLAELAGVEGIIGAFLAGLALNKLIPHTSPLMNRVEFVGNALFIPFFLISVGMLIDYKAFFKDMQTLQVASVMTITALVAKYLAAWFTAKTYQLKAPQLKVMFGLSSAQAAATLAAVLVGYNIIIAETATGEPIRLLDESILNGSILMILVTCTIASLVTQKGAEQLAANATHSKDETLDDGAAERILIASNKPEHIEHLVELALTFPSQKQEAELYALHVVNKQDSPDESDVMGKKILQTATHTAASVDVPLKPLLRYDEDVVHGIIGEMKAHRITDLIMGYSERSHDAQDRKRLVEGILAPEKVSVYMLHAVQPISTLQRNLVIVPQGAESEKGFLHWLMKVWNMGKQMGMQLKFYAPPSLKPLLEKLNDNAPLEYTFDVLQTWEDVLVLSREIGTNGLISFVMSREGMPSYNPVMQRIFEYLDKYFRSSNFLLIYPMQERAQEADSFYIKKNRLLNPSLDVEGILGRGTKH